MADDIWLRIVAGLATAAVIGGFVGFAKLFANGERTKAKLEAHEKAIDKLEERD